MELQCHHCWIIINTNYLDRFPSYQFQRDLEYGKSESSYGIRCPCCGSTQSLRKWTKLLTIHKRVIHEDQKSIVLNFYHS